jgi:hypothetical protein
VDRLLGKAKPDDPKKGGNTKDLLRRGLDQLLGR